MRPTTDLQRTVAPFRVVADFEPSGDQPTAIADLTRRIKAGEQDVVLLGATGTGKSATTAWLLDQPGRGGRLAGAGRAKQDDILLARLDAPGQVGDRRRLVAAGLEVGHHAERRNRPLEISRGPHGSTVDATADT